MCVRGCCHAWQCHFCGDYLEFCGHDPNWDISTFEGRPKRYQTRWNAELFKEDESKGRE